MIRTQIIKSESEREFENELSTLLNRVSSIISIHFNATPEIHSGIGGGAYSSGETYYALVVYKA